MQCFASGDLRLGLHLHLLPQLRGRGLPLRPAPGRDLRHRRLRLCGTQCAVPAQLVRILHLRILPSRGQEQRQPDVQDSTHMHLMSAIR